jgi:hypothetical protein
MSECEMEDHVLDEALVHSHGKVKIVKTRKKAMGLVGLVGIQALLALTIVASFWGNAFGFVSIQPHVGRNCKSHHHHHHARQGDASEKDGRSSLNNNDRVASATSRRNLFLQSLLSTTSVVVMLGGRRSIAVAAEKPYNKEPTIYLTGKAPIIPGQKLKDKNDVSGTRKDPNFLRSLSDCKSQCENRAGPDGLAKSKEDCLSECQDICCTTYEQYV